MKRSKEYDDIPGTYVLDGEHTRKGYQLNMFCMSLNLAKNREEFSVDEQAYIHNFQLTEAQCKAILERDWIGLLQLGGNIYYTFKLAIYDRISMQKVGGEMSQITEQEFQQMMIDGGRPVEGNRYRSEWKGSNHG